MSGTTQPLSMQPKNLPKKTGISPRFEDRQKVKPYLVSEISVVRKTRCPQISYEEKRRPGMFKRRLSAEDVIMGRYKYIPVTSSIVKEKSVINRQKKLISQVKKAGKPIPKILLPPEISDKENVPEKSQTDRSVRILEAPSSPKLEVDDSNEDDKDNINDLGASPRTADDNDEVFRQDAVASKIDDVESDDEDSDKEETDGFGEYVNFLVEKRREKKLNSDDFDTDLDSTETEEEEEDVINGPPPKKINKTLENYEKACVKCQMRPNATFLRQCGRHSLDIRYRMINYNDAKPIAIALVDDKKTSFMDLSHNPLGPIGVAAIADMLLINQTIIELNLSNTFPENEGMQALANCLGQNDTLRRLYLENNSLQSTDGVIIASLIENAPNLLELHLANNNLGFEGINKIGQALSLNKGKLNVLNLSYNNIRTDSAVQIATALKKNTMLRSLDLSWNGFGVEGCRVLATALQVNSTLRDLNLTCNRLGIKSLGFLLKGLIKNKGLHCVRVGMNPLTTEGVKTLVSAITTSKTCVLTELDLRGIPLDEEFFDLKDKLCQSKVIRVHYDDNVHLGTSDITRETDGTFLDNFNPVLVMYEFMKKDNLRVIDFFQFFDTRKRDKLSKSDLATGFNILMIPFTQHHVDMIMKSLDTNKDGFISLDEMAKGYTKNDKIVKKRRIMASRLKKTDEGLETLWAYLKSLIVKRKEENIKKNEAKTQARRDSLLPGGRRGSDGRRGSIFPGSDGRRGSIFPGAEGRRGSIMPGALAEGRRSSIPQGASGRQGSLMIPASETRRGSLSTVPEAKTKGKGTSSPSLDPADSATSPKQRGALQPGGSEQREGNSLSPRDQRKSSTEEGGRSRRLSQTRSADKIEEEA